MNGGGTRLGWNRAAGVLVVLALHGAVFYALWSARVIPPPAEAATLFVHFIAPPAPKPAVVPPPVVPKPKPVVPKPVERKAPPPVEPPHRHLAAKAPVTSPLEAVEPVPPPAPAIEPAPEAEPASVEPPAPVAPPPAPAKPAGPMMLNAELALACTQRTPPSYPRMSRRLGETGKTVLRVELDETGQVGAAQVITSSGFERLDAAALAAVKTWRCRPAQRDGAAVRSVATQPFNFTLEGR